MCLTELLCACPCYSVSYNNIKGSGEAFGEALKANMSLRTLTMISCGLDDNDSKGLAGGLAVHSGLTTVQSPANNPTPLSPPQLLLHDELMACHPLTPPLCDPVASSI